MKKLSVFLIMLVPFLTGCTNIDTNLTIKNDLSASIVTNLDYEGNIADSSDYYARLISDNYEKFLDDDYNIKTDFSDKKSSITASKAVKNLIRTDINLSSLGFRTNLLDEKYISVKKNFFVTFYNIDMTYNTPEIAKEVKLSERQKNNKISVMTPEYFQKYGAREDIAETYDKNTDFAENIDESTFILAKEDIKKGIKQKTKSKKSYDINNLSNTFTIELPMFASFNNADFNSGTKYIWNLRNDSPTIIKLQYVVYSSFSITLMLIAGLLLLIYMARRILRHDGQKRVGK